MQLVGFDSFEGMPAEAAAEGWTPGAYRSTLAATRRYLSSQGVKFENVELVKGWFEDTLTPATRERLGLTKASLIMVDCDTYSATKLALEFTLPLDPGTGRDHLRRLGRKGRQGHARATRSLPGGHRRSGGIFRRTSARL